MAIAAALAMTGQTAHAGDYPLIILPSPYGPWGGRIQDVEQVFRSAADALWVYFPGRTLRPILVEPRGGPITLYRHGPNGEYLMQLNTGNQLWAQHAFQFAHEFGHILANYDEHEWRNKWFEESICETASLFVLRRMSEVWEVQPPYPNWRNYAPALAAYADARIRTAHLPRGTTLAQWYRENELALREFPSLRNRNTVVAAALLPYFERQPESWPAIAWLNDGMSHGTRTFGRYLGDWHAHVPGQHRPLVRQIAHEFGITIEDETAGALAALEFNRNETWSR